MPINNQNEKMGKGVGFERIRLTSHTLGTPGQTAQMLEADNRSCTQELEQLEDWAMPSSPTSTPNCDQE